jgi:hypothetical protein
VRVIKIIDALLIKIIDGMSSSGLILLASAVLFSRPSVESVGSRGLGSGSARGMIAPPAFTLASPGRVRAMRG